MLLDVARVTVATLFNSIWEGALIAFCVWLLLRLLPNINATTRYIAWCAALAASILLPLATAVPKVSVEAAPLPQAISAPHSAGASNAAATAVRKTQPLARRTQSAPAPKNAQPPPFRFASLPRLALPAFAADALFALWGLVALAFLVRLAVNLRRLESLKADALPLPVDYREDLARWTHAEKGGRDVRLCVSDAIDVPVAIGLFDAMILIPKHLLDTLTPEEMDQVMLHELGHLRRADDWTNGMQRVMQALFFFNPAVAFIAQQLDLEREVACDDWVLAETKNVRPYAQCLTKMAQVTAWPHRPLAAPGVFVTRRGLSLRVERLLRAGRDIRTNLSPGTAGAIAAMLALMFFLVQTVAPSYAFTQPSVPAQAKIAAPVQHEKIVYIHDKAPARQAAHIAYTESTPPPAASPAASPAAAKTIVIPPVHVHVPARTIHIPAVNFDIPGKHTVFNPLPPDLRRTISREVRESLQAAGMGGDFSNANVRGRDFRGMRLTGADFSHADAQNANFQSANITGADFSGADVRGANFSGARMMGCDFSHANASGARFEGVSVVGCDFTGATLDPAQAANVLRGCSKGCDLSGLSFAGSDLRNVNVKGIDLSEADLRNADLSGATFTGVSFTDARMDGARLSGATFVRCTFDGVDRSRVNFGAAKAIIDEGGRR